MSKLDEIRKSVAENRAKNNGVYIPEETPLQAEERRLAEEKRKKEEAERAKQAQESELRRLAEEKRRKEEAEILERKNRIIVTTTPYVEGRKIKQYLGLASGADIYNAGGLIGGGYTTKGQTNLYQMAVSRAVNRIKNDAVFESADAIIGVQISLGSSSVMNQVIVTVTGTAVRLEPLTDSDE